jgi:RimK family alpha-L-glutamate ligase
MPAITIGFITNSRLPNLGDKKFKRISKKLGIELIIFNVAEKMDLKEIEAKAKACDVIFNDEADYIGLELAKSLEVLGCKVVELSKTFYYTEDKWLTYLKCLKHNIPVPKTMLLSTDFISIKKELKDFNQFPVILKRVEGYRGYFVDKADDIKEAVGVIKKFWTKGEDKFPIIAQEFVKSFSYRVLLIGGKVVQTGIKKSNNWKATGGSMHRAWKFKIDSELKEILKKLKAITDIAICGYDFAKQDGRWVLIEINAQPSFKFFDSEYDMIIEKVLKHLKKIALFHKK